MLWLRKLLAVVRKRPLDDDLAAELEIHIEMLTDDKVAAGMSRTQARREARIAVGNLSVAHELHREARGLPTLESVLQDLKYAFRNLRRDYGFTFVAVAILGIGIGANATVFSLVDALLLSPLPFEEPDRLIWIENGDRENPGSTNPSALASRVLTMQHWQASSGLIHEFGGYSPFFTRGSWALTGDGQEPERLVGVRVTDNLFPMLGIEPHLGRFFEPGEVVPDGPPAVILSHGLWERRFESDSSIVGRMIDLNDNDWTVVGVTPPDFDFGSVFEPGYNVQVFIPAVLDNMTFWGNTMSVVGRLAPGATIPAAQAELNAINLRLDDEEPELDGWTYWGFVSPLSHHVSKSVSGALWLLWGAVGMVLLIVCANLSNLMLVRGVSRRREMAVRSALGAGRSRLVRQLVTESLLLAGLGVAVGLGLAIGAMRWIGQSQGVVLPLLDRAGIDVTAFLFTAGLAVAVALLIGALPAIQVTRRDPFADLGTSTRGATGSRAQSLTRSSLVVVEVALACTLLIGAGLLIRSFGQILDVELGFEPTGRASFQVNAGSRYADITDVVALQRQLRDRLMEIPGVESVALTDNLPLDGNRSWGLRPAEDTEGELSGSAYVRLVGDGYFATMGIPVLSGRAFSADDADGDPVIIINETAAKALWPGKEAVGQYAVGGQNEARVIGVVADVRHNAMDEASGREMYFLVPQLPVRSSSFVVRTAGNPQAMTGQVRNAVREVDPLIPFTDFRPIEQLVDRAVSSRRFFMGMLTGFAGIALLLASLGIYGVISYSVGQRRGEIGIRLALGAQPGNVLMEEVRRGALMAGIGLALGLASALLATQLMASQLYGVGATDPVTYLGMGFMLLAVAMLAGFIPAQRAARTNPTTALRDAS
ncbi:MAG: FtsX-like permease family protein [Acidobacteria bacterium]|nr:FtsX-like permease family protein [Acidobacteriota bacterium]